MFAELDFIQYRGWYGDWVMVGIWGVLFSLFIIFIPFYKKSQRKPASVYIAFVVALAFEMFGIPLSMYFVTWIIGVNLPPGIFWQHTLEQYIGDWGMYIGIVLNIIGAILVIEGWQSIHKNYWSKEEGRGKLVTDGIYRYIRHPQYTGFMLITLGLLILWATIPLLIMWPILMLMYYRLAKREEVDIEKEFGNQYIEYKKKTSMFFPVHLQKNTPKTLEQFSKIIPDRHDSQMTARYWFLVIIFAIGLIAFFLNRDPVLPGFSLTSFISFSIMLAGIAFYIVRRMRSKEET